MKVTNEKTPLCRIVLATHGNLAKGMLDSVRLLMGRQDDLEILSLKEGQRMEEIMEELRREVEIFGEENVLVLTDLRNGSPFNAAVMLALEYPRLHHITGMNLAVVLSAVKARSSGEGDLDAICDRVIRETEGSIVDVRLLMEERMKEDVEDEEYSPDTGG